MNSALAAQPSADTAQALREHTLTLTVQPSDIDDLQHANNVAYLVWCEQAARNHSARVGMDIATLRALGSFAVVRRHNITYHRPALLGDQLMVRTVLSSSQGIRAHREFTIMRVDGTLLAECQTEWVWVDAFTGRPKRPQAGICAAFGF